MPFDGSGNFVRSYNWSDDAAAGIKILASRHDTEDNGFATGLSNTICRDGQSPILADVGWSGKKITNLGNPINPGDAATKSYCDTLSGWPTSKNISGADLNGRLNFTALGGVNGITWSNADMSWFGKAAVANQTSNRLVVNSSIDGTTASPGTDLLAVNDTGHIISSTGIFAQNLSYDGTSWRTPVAGTGTLIQVGGGSLQAQSNDTATTTVYQTVTPREYWGVLNSTGSPIMQLFKSASGKTNAIYGYTGASSLRWGMQLGDSAAESGSNAGSNFSIDRYSDAGAYLSTPFSIVRSTGAASFSASLSVGTSLTAANGVYAGYGLASHGPATTGSYGGNWINFLYQGGTTLYVYVDNSAFSIGMTACDYRIKQEVRPLESCWDKVKALRPVSYQLKDYEIIKADGIERAGFLAHEVQEALGASAANGEKDGEAIQSLDTVAIIAALASALQEAMLRIEALEARA